MSDKTHIEWTDATWNPVTGCSVVSPGCTNCYAMKLAGTRLQHHPSREGLTRDTKAGPVWNGEVRFNEEWLTQPLRWRKPRKIFVCAHGDLFHENVPDEWIDKVFAVMALAPQHTYQVLTKRADRMREYICLPGEDRGRRNAAIRNAMDELRPVHGQRAALQPRNPHIWLGISAEDQDRYDERSEPILDLSGQFPLFVSAEPLLGPLNLHFDRDHCDLCGGTGILARWPKGRCHICGGKGKMLINGRRHPRGYRRFDWVICGGESGKGARPMHPDWARSLRDQCAAAGVPFFFKQWGSWRPAHPGDPFAAGKWMHVNGDTFGPVEGEAFYPAPLSTHVVRSGKKAAGALLDGIEHKQFPTPA